MPTLDDAPTLPTLGAVKGQDSLLVSDKDGAGGTKVKRIPSALVNHGFTHGWLFNYDNSDIAATSGHAATNFDVYTFDANDRVDRVMVVCTEAFVGNSLSAAVVNVGANTQDPNGYIEDASVFALGTAENTGAKLATAADVIGGYDNPTDSNTLRISFDPDANNADLTAGQFVVLANIVNPTHFKDCLDPQ